MDCADQHSYCTPALIVPSGAGGQRLDTFLAQHWPGVNEQNFISRSAIQKLIDQGQVKLNNRTTKASVRIRAGDSVKIEGRPPVESGLESEDLPLDVIFEDEDLIVVNKCVGMVVHPAAGRTRGTLVNALLHHCPELAGIGGERRPGIVHRLDKDTSGVMIIAKNAVALENLARQFRDRSVMKEYLALVWGVVPGEKGILDRPIGRHRSDRKRMSSRYALPRRRDAVTEWRVVARFDGSEFERVTLLRLRPKTGRTHQIRVHLADFGFPLVGDRLYGGVRMRNRGLVIRSLSEFPRQALHAEKLAIDHPRKYERMCFEAPLPTDMREALLALEQRQSP